MKAIHNLKEILQGLIPAVNYTQRYKKWKQFTTPPLYPLHNKVLWTIHKDTKNESNSQLYLHDYLCSIGCELYTKIQKMKAIHNTYKNRDYEHNAVNYTQRYKKWKQFTTILSERSSVILLWTIHKDTKNESNSQLNLRFVVKGACCELYTKIQKMKAIHNTCQCHLQVAEAVNYTQRYKKWKQFTTMWSDTAKLQSCELYTKIQKMKAIHNCAGGNAIRQLAVNYTQRYSYRIC